MNWLAQSTKAPVEALPGQLTNLLRLLDAKDETETAEVLLALQASVNGDQYGSDRDGGLQIDIKGGPVGPAPTSDEMRRLRAGIGG